MVIESRTDKNKEPNEKPALSRSSCIFTPCEQRGCSAQAWANGSDGLLHGNDGLPQERALGSHCLALFLPGDGKMALGGNKSRWLTNYFQLEITPNKFNIISFPLACCIPQH